jgi:hypothetical protein
VCLGQCAVDPVVDAIDRQRRPRHFLVGAEGDRQHRLNRLAEPPQSQFRVTNGDAVRRDPGRDERMSDLQQDRRAPAEERRGLAIDLPGHRIGPGGGPGARRSGDQVVVGRLGGDRG